MLHVLARVRKNQNSPTLLVRMWGKWFGRLLPRLTHTLYRTHQTQSRVLIQGRWTQTSLKRRLCQRNPLDPSGGWNTTQQSKTMNHLLTGSPAESQGTMQSQRSQIETASCVTPFRWPSATEGTRAGEQIADTTGPGSGRLQLQRELGGVITALPGTGTVAMVTGLQRSSRPCKLHVNTHTSCPYRGRRGRNPHLSCSLCWSRFWLPVAEPMLRYPPLTPCPVLWYLGWPDLSLSFSGVPGLARPLPQLLGGSWAGLTPPSASQGWARLLTFEKCPLLLYVTPSGTNHMTQLDQSEACPGILYADTG